MGELINLNRYPQILAYCRRFKKEHREEGLEWENITLNNRRCRITLEEVEKILSFIKEEKYRDLLDLIEEDFAAFNEFNDAASDPARVKIFVDEPPP